MILGKAIEEKISLCTNHTFPQALKSVNCLVSTKMLPGLLLLAYMGDPYATAPGMSDVNEPVFPLSHCW